MLVSNNDLEEDQSTCSCIVHGKTISGFGTISNFVVANYRPLTIRDVTVPKTVVGCPLIATAYSLRDRCYRASWVYYVNAGIQAGFNVRKPTYT